MISQQTKIVMAAMYVIDFFRRGSGAQTAASRDADTAAIKQSVAAFARYVEQP